MGLENSKEQLTDDELMKVQKSWEIIVADPEENGVFIFKTSEYLSMFFTKKRKHMVEESRQQKRQWVQRLKQNGRHQDVVQNISSAARFLDKHNYYSKFEKFSGVPISELPNNKIFRKHAVSIINAINNTILHFDNKTLLKSDLNALGKMHGRRNVTEKEFQELKTVILDILDEVFKLEKETLNAWTKTLDMAFVYVFEGLKKD